jgi:hypothetical protein
VTAISVTGVPELKAALEQLDGKDRANTLRRAVRAAAKPFRGAMSQMAAAEGLPATFRKVPAPKVTTHGGRGPIEAYVRPKTALFNIFEPGARAHDIAPRSGGFLSNQASRGEGSRGAAFFARGTIHHPGLKARPIAARAFAIAEPAAMQAFTEVVAGAAAAKGED